MKDVGEDFVKEVQAWKDKLRKSGVLASCTIRPPLATLSVLEE